MLYDMTELAQHKLDRLTSEQVETLRLVYAHKGSKEIARIMGVSPHTVDQRMRRALKILGVSSRVDAARLLASHGVFQDVTPYQSLRYQPDNLADVVAFADVALRSADTVVPSVSSHQDEESSTDSSIPAPLEGREPVMGPKIWMLWLVLITLLGTGAVAILYFLLQTLAT